MSSTRLTPEKQGEIKELAQAIREAVDTEINELAANLATTDDAHLFGRNEFTIRALAHKIAAKAVEQHLAGKKTATKAPQ
jgi:predicted RNA-binding Zn ribbon-like protein